MDSRLRGNDGIRSPDPGHRRCRSPGLTCYNCRLSRRKLPMNVPRLATALTGPLPHLERHLLDANAAVEHWLRGQWQEHETPFHCSVDLRNSGVKIAPVDTNLFPGGFNNLNPEFHQLCVQAAMSALE